MRKLFKENLTTLFSLHCTRVSSKESRILAAMFGHGADAHVIEQTHPLKPTLELTSLDIGVVFFLILFFLHILTNTHTTYISLKYLVYINVFSTKSLPRSGWHYVSIWHFSPLSMYSAMGHSGIWNAVLFIGNTLVKWVSLVCRMGKEGDSAWFLPISLCSKQIFLIKCINVSPHTPISFPCHLIWVLPNSISFWCHPPWGSIRSCGLTTLPPPTTPI